MVADGTDCSNGIGFSPDGATLYWTCSTRGVIFAFDYDCAAGMLSNQRIFMRVGQGDGIPDGLAVDAEGCVYSARWGAEECGVVIYDPKGSEILRLPQPCKAVTSLCFAGDNLDRLVATTAFEANDAPGRHDLYTISGVSTAGRPEYRSAMKENAVQIP